MSQPVQTQYRPKSIVLKQSKTGLTQSLKATNKIVCMCIKNEKVLNIKLFSANPLLSPHTLVKDQKGYAVNKYNREKKKEIHEITFISVFS